MPHSPSDPNGPPRPEATPAHGSGVDSRRGSTGSHRPAPGTAGTGSEPSLSDLLRGGSSSARKVPSASDIANHLASGPTLTSDADVPLSNTDDSPTVITASGQLPSAPPPPPYVVGESPSVAGRRLGHFELIEAVGSGGMAAVLRARDLELGRIVALKILPPEATHDAENVTRFKQEARAAARLDHENIARVYYCGEDQGLHFIAFEFVEGITLRQMIDRRGPLPAGECIRYMIQVAAGLAHASERGVVHRDIKPSNIIITPDRRAKIVDMGLARHLDSATVNGGVTQSGVTLGTFDYISPEQALDPRRADVRSDIYSLGCAFYHALTGRPPVPEGTAAKKLHAHQHIDPLDPRELNPAIPDDVAAVLARMMAKDPDRRYQTPAELIANLKGVADKLHLPLDGLVADSAVQAIPADPHLLPEQPRLPVGWIIGLAGVAIAVAVLVIATSGPGPERTSERGPAIGGKRTPTPIAPTDKGLKGGTSAPSVERGIEVKTADELANALANSATTRIRLMGGQRYDLAALNAPIKFDGKQLELIGSAERPPTLTLAADQFSVQAETVVFRGIRFDIVPNANSESPPDRSSIGVTILKPATVELTDCIFGPTSALEATTLRLATVGIPAMHDAPPSLVVTRCVFTPGAIGLLLPAGTRTHIDDSGFGPHEAALRLTPHSEAVAGEVNLDRVSFMLEPGTAAIDAGGTNTTIRAGYCLYATTASAPATRPLLAVVARVDLTPSQGPRYEAVRKNAYYEVDPLGTDDRTFSFEQCQEQRLPAVDADRVKLKQRPWDSLPGGVLTPFAGADPHRAFRLRLTDPDVFASDDEEPRIFGARFQRGATRLAYKSWPPLKPILSASERPEKTWTPHAADESTLPPGHYKDLVKLLRDVRSGDTILIAGNGPVEIESGDLKAPSRIDKADFKLTIKPAPGFRPVLVCSPSNIELETALFRLFDGDVEFENLTFQVRPTDDRDALTAVSVLGGRKCTFTRCVFDLDENGKQATAVAIADPKAKMMLSPAAGRVVPRIEFDRCLIRGRGRGIAVADGQTFDLDVRDSITAIYGPVLLVHGTGKDLPSSPRAAGVKFTRTTALLGGPLLELHAARIGEMRTHGLAPVDITAEQSLFAAVPLVGRALIELNGYDPKDVGKGAEHSPLRWSTTRGSRYANFDPSLPALLVRPAGGEAEEKWDWNKWVGFAGEPADRQPVGKVTFANAPHSAAELALVVPTDMTLRTVEFPDLTDPADADVGPIQLRDVARPLNEETDTPPQPY